MFDLNVANAGILIAIMKHDALSDIRATSMCIVDALSRRHLAASDSDGSL
jgi:hypothetical protein